MRIFGPDKSAMMATGRPAAFDAARMFSMFCRCAENSPCEKFRRATFMPARSICSRTGGALDAGPIVATILVLLGGSIRSFGSGTSQPFEIQLHHVAKKFSHRARRLGVGGAGLFHFDGVLAEVGHSQVAQQQAAVAVRIRAHAVLAPGRDFNKLRFEAAIL